jgi:hypothetical protein
MMHTAIRIGLTCLFNDISVDVNAVEYIAWSINGFVLHLFIKLKIQRTTKLR